MSPYRCRVSADRASTPDLADPQLVGPELAGLRRARAQQERVREGLLWSAPVVLPVIVLVSFRIGPHPGITGQGLVVSVALGGFVLALLGVRGTVRRSDRWHLPPTLALIASSAALMWVQPNGVGAVGVLLGFIFLARRLPGPVGLRLSVAAFVALVVVDSVRSKGPNVWLLAFIGGFYGMVFLAYRLAAANEQAERLLIQLRASRAAEAYAAGLAERQRLAREMHDVLAHSLSGLMLQLEGARMLAAENPDDPRLPETIDRAHHLAQSGLIEARRAIGMLRDDELPGPERLAGLAEQFEADRGVPCHLAVDGEAHLLGSETRLALYRVAQEALTNISKHAHPERVELRLAYEPSAVRLVIEDFAAIGSTDPMQAPDGGYGLTGMRERAELLGGTLTTEATSGGFRVELGVPV